MTTTTARSSGLVFTPTGTHHPMPPQFTTSMRLGFEAYLTAHSHGEKKAVERSESGEYTQLMATVMWPVWQAAWRAAVQHAKSVVLNCPHTIAAEEITLRFDPPQPGHNTLHQLGRRISAAGAAEDGGLH